MLKLWKLWKLWKINSNCGDVPQRWHPAGRGSLKHLASCHLDSRSVHPAPTADWLGRQGVIWNREHFFHNFHNFHNLHNFMKLWKLWISLSRSQLWVPNEGLTQKSKRSDLFISLCFPETFAREIAQPNGQTYRNYWKRVYFHNFHNFINCGNCGNCGKCGNCGNCGINNPQKCLIFPKPWENKTFGVKTVPKSSSQPQRDRKSLFSWFSLPGPTWPGGMTMLYLTISSASQELLHELCRSSSNDLETI